MRFYAKANKQSKANGLIIVQVFSKYQIRLKKLRYLFFSTFWDLDFLENPYNDAVFSNGALVVRLNIINENDMKIEITSYSDYLKGLEYGTFGTDSNIEIYNIYNLSN